MIDPHIELETTSDVRPLARREASMRSITTRTILLATATLAAACAGEQLAPNSEWVRQTLQPLRRFEPALRTCLSLTSDTSQVSRRCACVRDRGVPYSESGCGGGLNFIAFDGQSQAIAFTTDGPPRLGWPPYVVFGTERWAGEVHHITDGWYWIELPPVD